MLARRVGSWSANQVVNYSVDFLSPWVKQVGDLIYGIFRNADVNTQRIDGTTITLRTSAAVNAGSCVFSVVTNIRILVTVTILRTHAVNPNNLLQ